MTRVQSPGSAKCLLANDPAITTATVIKGRYLKPDKPYHRWSFQYRQRERFAPHTHEVR